MCAAANWKRKIPRDAVCAVRINAAEWMERRSSQSLRKMELASVLKGPCLCYSWLVFLKEPSCGMTLRDMSWEFDVL